MQNESRLVTRMPHVDAIKKYLYTLHLHSPGYHLRGARSSLAREPRAIVSRKFLRGRRANENEAVFAPSKNDANFFTRPMMSGASLSRGQKIYSSKLSSGFSEV